MQKRLAHGIKREGPRTKTGRTKRYYGVGAGGFSLDSEILPELKRQMKNRNIINDARKIRRANLILEKLKAKGANIPWDFKEELKFQIHRANQEKINTAHANVIINKYLEFMKKNNKKYSDLTSKDAKIIITEIRRITIK